MHSPDSSQYRTIGAGMPNQHKRGVALVLDTRAKAIERHDPRRRALEQNLHTMVVQTTDDGVAGGWFADWHFDLRRGRLRLLGGLLRYIDVQVRKRTPRALLFLIPDWIRAYIDEETAHYADEETTR